MQAQSMYVIPCVCGKQLQSHNPVVVCPYCGKLIEVKDWGK